MAYRLLAEGKRVWRFSRRPQGTVRARQVTRMGLARLGGMPALGVEKLGRDLGVESGASRALVPLGWWLASSRD